MTTPRKISTYACFAFFMLFAFESVAADESDTTLLDTLQYCFSQLSYVHVQGPVLKYNQVIAQSDRGQVGYIFVAARRESEPERWWVLRGSGEWVEFDASSASAPDGHGYFDETDIIFPAYIKLGTQDVHDMEIWVGYGVGSDRTVAFGDMLDSNRFKQIWRSSPTGSSLGVGLVNASICITPAKLSVKEEMIGVYPPNPVDNGVTHPVTVTP